MMRRLPLIILLIVAVAGCAEAYGKFKRVPDCRKIVVQDPDRRGFDDRGAFALDVDGDGRLDSVTSRIYGVKVHRKAYGKRKAQTHEQHWISFDARTRKGVVLRSFFKYNYGGDDGDYWVYAWNACTVNKGKEAALLFYSGDDTSEDTKILVKRGDVFKVYWQKLKSSDW